MLFKQVSVMVHEFDCSFKNACQVERHMHTIPCPADGQGNRAIQRPKKVLLVPLSKTDSHSKHSHIILKLFIQSNRTLPMLIEEKRETVNL